MNKGHYVIACKKTTVVSALVAIPKDDTSNSTVHDGSRPAGQAMNDYSVPESVKFQTADVCKLANLITGALKWTFTPLTDRLVSIQPTIV